MEVIIDRCAGLDVGEDEVVACWEHRHIGSARGRTWELRMFSTFTSGLEPLADWLTANAVEQVVIKRRASTGSRSGVSIGSL